jgi:hypothetical protein
VAVHGHFYQPPREHPWLDVVETEPSARPHHDWNARITAECYGPNTAARLLGPHGGIRALLNTFERISFNVGPTLFRWLAAARPDVAARIVEADRRSAARLAGHGNAIAQPYVHAILPLQGARDRTTLLRWGAAEFRYRFGRPADGAWLPETAVDRATLAALADEGLAFTVLAPSQIARVRPSPAAGWRPAAGALDPRRPYRVPLGGGRSQVVFVYDGGLAHAVAFGGLLSSGEAFAARLLAALEPPAGAGAAEAAGPRLAHLATDGESYGHHHRFGEMALAAALERVERDERARLTSYGAFLAAWPRAAAMAEAELVEPSAWSCAHGVGRWQADCGCRAGGPERHQRWRAPLREALDWLAAELDLQFEADAGPLLKEPWEARDAYVDVLLDPSPAGQAAFLARHQLHPLDAGSRVRAFELLEAQRHRLLMYTSCAWFFDDVAGGEATQALRHAARAVGLAGAAGGRRDLERGLLRRLALAPGNDPALPTAAAVYEARARPAAVSPARVAAQAALAGLAPGAGPWALGALAVEVAAGPVAGAASEASGPAMRVRVTDGATTAAHELLVRRLDGPAGEPLAVVEPAERGREGGPARPRGGTAPAGHRPAAFGLDALLPVARERVAEATAARARGRLAAAVLAARDEAQATARALREAGEALPAALARVLALAAGEEVARALGAAASGRVAAGIAGAREALDAAAALDVAPDLGAVPAGAWLEAALASCLGRLDQTPERAARDALAVLALAGRLEVPLDPWAAQTGFAEWAAGGPGAGPGRGGPVAELASALGFEGPAPRPGEPGPA